MVKSRPSKKQPERSDLPGHIIMLIVFFCFCFLFFVFVFFLLFPFNLFNSYLLSTVVLKVADLRDAARFQKLTINQ